MLNVGTAKEFMNRSFRGALNAPALLAASSLVTSSVFAPALAASAAPNLPALPAAAPIAHAPRVAMNGTNGVITFRADESVAALRVRVSNLSGVLLFDSGWTNAALPLVWQARDDQGRALPDDTYPTHISARLQDGTTREEAGRVALQAAQIAPNAKPKTATVASPIAIPSASTATAPTASATPVATQPASQTQAGPVRQVVGAGTRGRIAVWLGPNQIGDSIIRQGTTGLIVEGDVQALRVIVNAPSGTAITGSTPNGTGVVGLSANQAGVFGFTSATQALAAGVSGLGPDKGTGVLGAVQGTGTGVRGLAPGAGGIGVNGVAGNNGFGVFGDAGSSNAFGVYGRAKGTGTGVFGTGAIGVQGQTETYYGVYGKATKSGFGVLGESASGPGTVGRSQNGSGVVGGSEIAPGIFGSSGTNVGIFGTSTKGVGVFGTTVNDQPGVLGNNSGTGSGVMGSSERGDGVQGTASAAGKAGVQGRNDTETGVGVQGNSLNGAGVSGISNTSNGVVGSSNTGFGIIGITGNFDSQGTSGVIGVSNSNGSGVRGISNESTGRGVQGQSNNGTGVFGISSSGLAGRFDGNVQINGNVTVTGTINGAPAAATAPTKTAFAALAPGLSVESGNVTTNARGVAVVRVPHFAHGGDYRYQLTVIGSFARAMVAQELVNGAFTIRTETPRTKVSWQVTGVASPLLPVRATVRAAKRVANAK